jgi:hypothetical protein
VVNNIRADVDNQHHKYKTTDTIALICMIVAILLALVNCVLVYCYCCRNNQSTSDEATTDMLPEAMEMPDSYY